MTAAPEAERRSRGASTTTAIVAAVKRAAETMRIEVLKHPDHAGLKPRIGSTGKRVWYLQAHDATGQPRWHVLGLPSGMLIVPCGRSGLHNWAINGARLHGEIEIRTARPAGAPASMLWPAAIAGPQRLAGCIGMRNIGSAAGRTRIIRPYTVIDAVQHKGAAPARASIRRQRRRSEMRRTVGVDRFVQPESPSRRGRK